MASFEVALGIVLEHEGGDRYTDRPNDRGGPTRWGITQHTLSDWRGRPVTAVDVQRLGRDEAVAIYRARYWGACRCGDIADQALATKIFDTAVNAGVGFAGRALQRSVNAAGARVLVDGHVGPATIAALNAAQPWVVLQALCELLRDHYLEILASDPKQEENRRGWLARAQWPLEVQS